MAITIETTILEKNGTFAAVGKYINTDVPAGVGEGFVRIYDKRVQGNFVQQNFNRGEDVDGNYQAALRTSIERGWKPCFRGGRLNDPSLS
jgi:hypothetical protein